MPKVTQHVMGNEVAEPQCSYTNCPRKRGRKEEGGGREGGGIPAGSGSGPGQEGQGQKYLCSHLNVNQVWLEQGSRDRGGRSKRKPDRREEAEMGVVRGRGRGAKGESKRARQCWEHWGWGPGGQPETSHPKQPKGTGRRVEV